MLAYAVHSCLLFVIVAQTLKAYYFFHVFFQLENVFLGCTAADSVAKAVFLLIEQTCILYSWPFFFWVCHNRRCFPWLPTASWKNFASGRAVCSCQAYELTDKQQPSSAGCRFTSQLVVLLCSHFCPLSRCCYQCPIPELAGSTHSMPLRKKPCLYNIDYNGNCLVFLPCHEIPTT